MEKHDVVVVGYGPVGKLLTRLLLDRGHSVAVVERWPQDYPLPRAIAFYHDVARMFHALGMWEDVTRLARPGNPSYKWFNADWDLLIEIPRVRDSLSGGPELYTLSQPELESLLDATIREHSGVTFYRGYAAETVTQDDRRATLTMSRFDTEKLAATGADRTEIAADYIVGCDGANTMIGEAIGGGYEDLGFRARWLVVDIVPSAEFSYDSFVSGQWCNPERPTTVANGGKNILRWEFQMRQGETDEEVTADDFVWNLVSHWITPDKGTLIRKAVYEFRSLNANNWRDHRLLVAGDAAHRMPPFLGQGMCSGLRDAWDLAWQLDFVLRGLAPETLLDTYQDARGPHVRYYIAKSIELGQVVCEEDPQKAAERDRVLKSGALPEPPQHPNISGGLLSRDTTGKPRPGAGDMVPHSRIVRDGKTVRLDDLTGRNFFLVTLVDAVDALSAEQLAFLDSMEIARICLTEGHDRDLDGKLLRFLDDRGADAVLVRPDFYAFGLSDAGFPLSGLVDQLRLGLASPAASKAA